MSVYPATLKCILFLMLPLVFPVLLMSQLVIAIFKEFCILLLLSDYLIVLLLVLFSVIWSD